jgi:hypothetical protein
LNPAAEDVAFGSLDLQNIPTELPPPDHGDQPPFPVPAAPWTALTTDDEAVSHLVSLFIVWINPTWRFLETDLFLMGEWQSCAMISQN